MYCCWLLAQIAFEHSVDSYNLKKYRYFLWLRFNFLPSPSIYLRKNLKEMQTEICEMRRTKHTGFFFFFALTNFRLYFLFGNGGKCLKHFFVHESNERTVRDNNWLIIVIEIDGWFFIFFISYYVSTRLRTITDRRQHYNSYGVRRENRLARFKNKIVGDEPKKTEQKIVKSVIYDGKRRGGERKREKS